jgi:hypothetical protein
MTKFTTYAAPVFESKADVYAQKGIWQNISTYTVQCPSPIGPILVPMEGLCINWKSLHLPLRIRPEEYRSCIDPIKTRQSSTTLENERSKSGSSGSTWEGVLEA